MRNAFVAFCLMLAGLGVSADTIVTGGKTGTYYAIGTNLHDIIAKNLLVQESEGSWKNVEDLSETKGVSLAIVQSDVYASFVRLRDEKSIPAATRTRYAELLKNLRVFMPLYKEEIHFIVRKDDPMQYIQDIKDKNIWMDTEKSGTYLTAANIYLKVFGAKPNAVVPFVNDAATGDDVGTKRRRSALMALGDPGYYKAFPRIDVMVLVGGQPLALLQKAIPSNLKLLKFDPSQSDLKQSLLQDYEPADIDKSSYPLLNMPGNSVPSLAVTSYLITAVFADQQRNDFIRSFAGQFCTKLPALQREGHAKWKSIAWQPGVPLPSLKAGWQYSDIAKRQLEECGRRNTGQGSAPPRGEKPSPQAPAAGQACSDVDLSLGLCRR